MVNTKTSLKPPRLAVWLIKRFFPDETGLYTQLGDIDEAFRAIANENNAGKVEGFRLYKIGG